MLDDLLLTCPYPTLDLSGGELFDGLIFKVPSYCSRNARKHECRRFHASLEEGQTDICPSGFTACSIPNANRHIVGMIDAPARLPKERRGLNRLNQVPKHQITRWLEVLKFQSQALQQNADQQTGDALHVLHDLRILNGQIKVNAEREIRQRHKGLSLADAFEQAHLHLKAIYKASELLTGQLDLISFYFNPSQITRGKKSDLHVYRLFDKVKRIYQVRADERKVSLNMIGSSNSCAVL